MADQEFPCRTKMVSGTTYYIKMYRVSDGALMGTTSDESEDGANRYVESMKKVAPGKYSYEIIPEPWTQKVCIECGQEAW